LKTEILISSDPWENRVAILEDGSLAELYIEREERVIGSIYKGKVQNVLPGMGAAFVDIGLGRNAFLYVDDINKQPLNIGDVEFTRGHSGFTIGEKVKRGDEVLVQIVKEPRALKGARISTNISLPGRYLILMPTGRYSGVSRKIESAQERNRLKGIMQRIRPEGMATVVRTAAAGVSEAELIADLGVLIRMWHGILETYRRASAPALLHKDMNLVYKAARDFVTADVDRVLIDDETEYRRVREFLQLLGPQYLDRVGHYERGRQLFEDFKVDEELQRLLRPKINLPSGGTIVIESTEALTVIDVNSGKFTGGKNLEDTIVKTNVEAATEIARQVRLRDIGGIIVVDFIDMSSEASRDKVIKALEEGLRRDRTRSTIQSFSNLGLLEFTRKRIGKDLAAQLQSGCPTCNGLGNVMSPQSVAIEAFRQIRDQNGKGTGPLTVYVAPNVASQMHFWYADEYRTLASELQREILVRADAMLPPEHWRVERPAATALDGAVRVGDEHEVELLPGRLPTATSAAAVVGDRIVEVENGANNAGTTARIRILDVDDENDSVVAELVTVGAPKKRRTRKRKAAPSAVDEAKALRELAEEAAQQAQSRPPIGITTITEEEEAQDKTLAIEAKAQHRPDAIVIGDGATDGRRKRRRRRGRRGRGGRGRVQTESVAINAGISPVSAEAQIAVETHGVAPPTAGEPGKKHRRRRRRRGRGGAGAQLAAIAPFQKVIAGPPAVEAPPPSLRVPEAQRVVEAIAKPTRRPRKRRAAVATVEEVSSQTPMPEPAEKPARKTRRKAGTSGSRRKSPPQSE
jgi:ribonuclease G